MIPEEFKRRMQEIIQSNSYIEHSAKLRAILELYNERSTHRRRDEKAKAQGYLSHEEKLKIRKRFRNRLNKFKLSHIQLRAILLKTKCDLCGSLDPKSKRGWHLDHNHSTGQVRGILCHRCNCFRLPVVEDVIFLEKALKYLKDPPGIT